MYPPLHILSANDLKSHYVVNALRHEGMYPPPHILT